jgi:hypothetical protein
LLARQAMSHSEEDLSISKLFVKAVERELRQADDHWPAYKRMLRIKPVRGLKGSQPLTRDEAHARR